MKIMIVTMEAAYAVAGDKISENTAKEIVQALVELRESEGWIPVRVDPHPLEYELVNESLSAVASLDFDCGKDKAALVQRGILFDGKLTVSISLAGMAELAPKLTESNQKKLLHDLIELYERKGWEGDWNVRTGSWDFFKTVDGYEDKEAAWAVENLGQEIELLVRDALGYQATDAQH